jgi:hypothetical protein
MVIGPCDPRSGKRRPPPRLRRRALDRKDLARPASAASRKAGDVEVPRQPSGAPSSTSDTRLPFERVGFANSGGLVFVDESAEQIASA